MSNKVKGNNSCENTDCEADIFSQLDSSIESSQQAFAACFIRGILGIDADQRQAGRGNVDVRCPR